MVIDKAHKAVHPRDTDARQTKQGILVGILVQTGLGMLLGCSAMRQTDNFYIIHMDDMAVLLVLMSLLVAVVSLQETPHIELHIGRRTRVGMVAGLAWYVLLALWSRWYYFRGVICTAADPWIALALLAAMGLPAVLLLVFMDANRHPLLRNIPVTPKTFALLALCLILLPLNMQLGQLPLIVLAFVIAFYAGFLLKDPRVFLFSVLVSALGTIACALHGYMGDYPFAATSEGYLLRLSGHGLASGQYLVLVCAMAVALLSYVSRKARYVVTAIIGYFLFCMLLTKTRGALMGLGVALVTYAIIHRNEYANRRKSAVVVLAVMVCAALCLWINLGRADSNANHMDNAEWALRLFAESPLIGNGIGTWRANLDRFAVAYGYFPIELSDSHNVVTEILCSAGLVGILIAGFVTYVVVSEVLRVCRRLESDTHRNAFLVCLAGIAGYVFTWLTAVTYWIQQLTPCIPVVLGIWCGIAASGVETPAPPVRRSVCQRTAYALLLATGLASIAFCASRVLPIDARLSQILQTRHFQVYGLFFAERPRGDILVTVKDERDRPVEGVRLTLSPGGAERRTNTDGTSIFRGVRKRSGQMQHLLTARCPGYRDVTLSVNQVEQVWAAQTSVQIRLTRRQGLGLQEHPEGGRR